MGAHISKNEGAGHSEVNTAARKAGGSRMMSSVRAPVLVLHKSSIVHRVNGRSIANAGARGAGDVTPALPVAADCECALARHPDSPWKAAPQDLFTTPGYHASPPTRYLGHVVRRSSRACRTTRHTACQVSDTMWK